MHWIAIGLLAAAIAAPPALAQTGVDPHAGASMRSVQPHLTRQEALALAEEHLRAVGPTGARLWRVQESDILVTAELIGPDGGPAGRVVVDVRTGAVRTEP
jgi:hypothetical protein